MALLGGGASLHEWLAQSPYVRGHWDELSATSINRKKCRARRKTAAASSSSVDDADAAQAGHGGRVWDGAKRVGNRKHRRWLNEQLLRDLTPPLDAADIESLFAPPPWGDPPVPSPLQCVAEGGPDAAAWEPFRAVDMDAQARWLAHRADLGQRRTTATTTPLAWEMAAWKKLGQRTREALRRNSRSPLLRAFEERLLTYLSNDAEEIENGGRAELAMEAETAYHRLLLHGLTEFHGLASRTAPGQSVVVIKARDAAASRKREPLHLVDFLLEVQRHSSLVEAAT